jgi:hypothetical protein
MLVDLNGGLQGEGVEVQKLALTLVYPASRLLLRHVEIVASGGRAGVGVGFPVFDLSG